MNSKLHNWPKTAQFSPKQPKTAQNSPNVKLCFKERADSRTLLERLCSDLFHIRYQIIKIPSLLSICFSAKLVVLVDKSSVDSKLKEK